MNNEGVTMEAICSKCIHRSICKHTDNLLEFQQQIYDMINDYIFSAAITCKYYADKGNTILNYKEGMR